MLSNLPTARSSQPEEHRTRKLSYILVATVVAAAMVAFLALGQDAASAESVEQPATPVVTQDQVVCVTCHLETTPQIVSDWQQSAHSEFDVDCSVCHGEGHTSADDVAEVQIPTPDTCAECHEERVQQFSRGNPTDRLGIVQAADVARLTEETWQAERDKMLAVCSDCHSENYAREELAKGDDLIRETDELMAEAIRLVAGLYQDGLLEKPEAYAYPFPDLLTFHDAPTEIEQELFVMFLEHRMRAFQGAFHNNPDYALWYGWSEMLRSLTRIRTMAEEMRSR